MKRIAVLDLGTNTFNILIAEADEKDYTILHSGKRPVKLGEGGINRGEIIPTAIARGLKAIEEYAQIIRQYKVTELKAFGTSALRSASNGYLLTDAIRESTGIEVEIVSGDREAELIYLGVRQTLLLNNKNFLSSILAAEVTNLSWPIPTEFIGRKATTWALPACWNASNLQILLPSRKRMRSETMCSMNCGIFWRSCSTIPSTLW